MYSIEEKIKWFAVTSRLFLFILQCCMNYAFSDHNPGVFQKPLPDNFSLDSSCIVSFFTSGMTRWDGQYFLHIAEYGYTYENTLAFFPLFPLLIRSLGHAFQFAVNNVLHLASLPIVLNLHDSITLMALVFNFALFVQCSLVLFRLSMKVVKNEKIAYISALLFCVNPASIFFSAAYSETLFFYLTLNAMLYAELGHILTSSVLIGLSAMTRSNGLINVGYIIYRLLKTRRNSYSIVLTFIVFIACLIVSLFPFAVYQFYGFTKFCQLRDHNLPEYLVSYAERNDYVLPGNGSKWCNYPIPLSYSFVQQHYWNVGFLKYYEIKQIPNFVLAFPALLIAVVGALRFIKSHGWVMLWLGFVPGARNAVLPSCCFPYMAHATFLAVFGAFCMHVQVSTRLLYSSCPFMYWYSAEMVSKFMIETKESAAARRISGRTDVFYEPNANKNNRWKTVLLTERFTKYGALIRYHSFSYFLAGISMFSNNLPWT